MAFLYSSVGHGGASGYLAILAIFSFSPAIMKPSALILNVCVSLLSFYYYQKSGVFKWHLFWPFALGSIPASYIGATVPLSDLMYKKILGLALLLAIFRMVWVVDNSKKQHTEPNVFISILIGGGIGLLSGMIGIGGGIILSPIILLFHWANMKETAAISALFIFVNSIAGLTGLFGKSVELSIEIYLWVGIAIISGTAGAYYGAQKFNSLFLRRILAFVLGIAAIKLIFT
jgi:uncharacterized membrane protein YfcA